MARPTFEQTIRQLPYLKSSLLCANSTSSASSNSNSSSPTPTTPPPLMETHCHLDYLKSAPTEEILKKSKELGVKRFITISVTPDNMPKVLEIARRHEDVFCSQGIHPHHAQEWSEQTREQIKRQAKCPEVVAIGEIGLDYHYDHSPRAVQRQVFERQLELASEENLPVIIHTRKADEDTMDILRASGKSLSRKGVLHCFSSGPKLALWALEQGFYLGIGGIITFRKAEEVRQVLEMTPVDQILLETDAPFLTPSPHRGKENAPFYLPFIAQKVIELKGIQGATEDLGHQILTQIYQNGVNLFGLASDASDSP